MAEYEEGLKKAGLTGNEAKVYVELLKRGTISANELAKKISMDRTLSYTVLNHLIEKGLVNYVIKNKKKFFEASDPDYLMKSIKEQESYIKDLIPQLKNIEKTKEIEQEIKVYEGIEGIRTVMYMMAKEKGFISFGSTGRAFDMIYEAPRKIKELIKKGYKTRIIASEKYRKHKMIEIEGIEFRFLNIKSEASTSIFGDNVAIVLLTQKPIAIVIKNKEIAESYRNHFEILWDAAKL